MGVNFREWAKHEDYTAEICAAFASWAENYDIDLEDYNDWYSYWSAYTCGIDRGSAGQTIWK